MSVNLDVSLPDTIGKHDVSASRNGDEYAGHFNVYDDKERIRWAKIVGERFKLPEDEWAAIPDRLVSKADSEIERSKRTHRVERFTLAELRTQYPEKKPPIIDGLLRRGEVGNLIAPSKQGKSWGVTGLGVGITLGWDWLGRFPVSQGPVLHIDNELHREELAYRIPKVAAAMFEARSEFMDESFQEAYEVWPLRGKLQTLEQLGREFEEIQPRQFNLIILDAKYRFQLAGVSESDNSADTQVYNLLDRYAAELDTAILLVHHTSKGNQADKRTTDVGSGAGAQSRAADCHIVLREHQQENHIVLDAAVRSFPPIDPIVLKWDYPLWHPTDLDPADLKGKRTRSEERQEEKDQEGIKQIAKALLDEPLTARKVREATGLGKDRADRLLAIMASKGQVIVEEITIRGNICSEYRLAL